LADEKIDNVLRFNTALHGKVGDFFPLAKASFNARSPSLMTQISYLYGLIATLSILIIGSNFLVFVLSTGGHGYVLHVFSKTASPKQGVPPFFGGLHILCL
jgi:hypothetical protein